MLLIPGRGSAGSDAPPAPRPGPEAPSDARPDPSRDIEERFRRLEALVDRQAGQIRRLAAENRELSRQVRERPSGGSDPQVTTARTIPAAAETLPVLSAEPRPASPLVGPAGGGATGPRSGRMPSAYSSTLESGNDALPGADLGGPTSPYFAGLYDKGFVLVAPRDKERTPFALKLNVTNQLRYTNFSRSVTSWTNSAGKGIPVSNRSYFALNRNYFSFSGFAFSPRLRFDALVFTTSTTNQTIALGLVSYEFSKAFSLGAGYYKVPGTREWLQSFRYTLGADRTLANTFFRPSISPGVWASGEPLDGLHYYAGIFNDFDSTADGASRVNNHMTYSGNVWWEPLAPFGPGYSDEEYHEDLAVRTGGSFTYQRAQREPTLQGGLNNPENTILRLSDGTPIFRQDALAPGVTLREANVALFSYDLAFKYRGFSLSGEYYARWIYGLNATGGSASKVDRNIVDTGGLAQISCAVIPERFELFARASGVFGPFGDGSDYGGGANWYSYSNRNVRATFEAKRVNHSPADNPLYGYFAGESGMLYQLQLLTDF